MIWTQDYDETYLKKNYVENGFWLWLDYYSSLKKLKFTDATSSRILIVEHMYNKLKTRYLYKDSDEELLAIYPRT